MKQIVQLTRKDNGKHLAINIDKVVLFNEIEDGGTILFLDHGQVREVLESYAVIAALLGGVKVVTE